MAKPLSSSVRKPEPWHPDPSDGLLIAGTWSLIAVGLGSFLLWLLL